MFVGENEQFPPLASASPRLLFDFLPALMSRSDKEKTHTERRRAPNHLLLVYRTKSKSTVANYLLMTFTVSPTVTVPDFSMRA